LQILTRAVLTKYTPSVSYDSKLILQDPLVL